MGCWNASEVSMFRPDTSPEVQKVYDQKIRRLSEEERFLRGLSLTHFCRQICLAGIQDQHPSMTPEEMKIAIFERIYGPTFPTAEKHRIYSFLRSTFP